MNLTVTHLEEKFSCRKISKICHKGENPCLLQQQEFLKEPHPHPPPPKKKKKRVKKRETLFGQSDVRVSFEIGVFK
jgi:hypothetical protein